MAWAKHFRRAGRVFKERMKILALPYSRYFSREFATIIRHLQQPTRTR
jgi:hypothetical protein